MPTARRRLRKMSYLRVARYGFVGVIYSLVAHLFLRSSFQERQEIMRIVDRLTKTSANGHTSADAASLPATDLLSDREDP